MKRGIAIVTYNRTAVLEELISSVLATAPENCRVVVCDDGSIDNTAEVVSKFSGVVFVRGANLGVAANKNRALFSLQDCSVLAILEDDLFPSEKGWFEKYEEAHILSGVHHFCRVQDRTVPEVIPSFQNFMVGKGHTPIYGPSPRGDFTFITNQVLQKVGGFNSAFKGAGYAHGEWSERVYKSGLIGHPNKWVDIEEANKLFYQKGDQEGGRWNLSTEELRLQLKANRLLRKRLDRSNYIYHPLVLM